MGVETPNNATFRGLDLSELNLDQAYVDISNSSDPNSKYLYLRSDNCYKCPFRSYDQFFEDYSNVRSCFDFMNYPYLKKFIDRNNKT